MCSIHVYIQCCVVLRMAASMELSAQNVVNALKNVTIKKTMELAFHLGVEENVLDDITDQYHGISRKRHSVQAWLNNDTGASWEKLVSGLRHIGMGIVANSVESAFVAKVRGPVANSSSARLSPATVTPMQPISTPEVAHAAPIPVAPAPTAVEPFNPFSQLSVKVAEVKMVIKEFEDAFSELMSVTQSSMSDKESQDRKFLNKFRVHLLVLPVSKKAIHVKFFRESEGDILKAKNIGKLIAILSRYCNYTNYEIILHLVEKFCEAALKKRMLYYRDLLMRFEMVTTVEIYLRAISAGRKIIEAFSRMLMKIDKPASVCTLHEIRMLKEDLAKEASLHSYGMYIHRERD